VPSLDTLLHRYLSPWPPIAFLGLVPETQKHPERKVISGRAEMRAVCDSEIERPPERKLIGFNYLEPQASRMPGTLVPQLPVQTPCTLDCVCTVLSYVYKVDLIRHFRIKG
jgi:hypothetical protein